ncbi:hypothetical protein BU25DRAFT_405962 [Macroventuria anomochaeta]|uniref:Uncharacterized protein n=1 Tax=Macroventuria anomochaeta TaxID=301207 RepID=A0ACB6SGC9_9PLEO|nr:uncharacterized protein BU25DRAFT_405962 [Macroventuria anomochaeta]KAF2632635.1 hypothetical protein BU25DRAFT_405962 [Macroventuria anomochaeta]
MLTRLLDLPSELLLQILATLPVKPLLRFAQTSHYARSLAYSNLQSLSLAIYPSHRSSWHNKLFIAQHKPKHALHAAIQIPRAWDFDYTTLLTFHNKIVASILSRHASVLQKLELTFWTLSIPIARAIAKLPALKELNICIETVQAVPRAYMNVQRKEEGKAWALLPCSPSWTHLIHTLRIENAKINTSQLHCLIAGAGRLRELALRKCDMLTSSLWDTERLSSLRHLSITDCANVHANSTALEAISKMQRLKVLDLHGCSGLDGEVLEQWNRDVWRVPLFVAPRPRGMLKEEVHIEVDPDYLLEQD